MAKKKIIKKVVRKTTKKTTTIKRRVVTKKPTVVRIDKYQTPKSRKSIKSDRKRTALPPGRRISVNGNTYTEHRQNRSDKKKTRL